MNNPLNRRDWLKFLGLGALGGAASQLPLLAGDRAWARQPALAQQPAAPATRPAGRALRVAHLTDVHIQPELDAGEGFARCLRHVQAQADKPDLIVITGDCIMDGYRKDRARTQLQWDLWARVLKAECSLPVMPLLGNHDIWGWDKRRSATTGDEAGWGKRWACDALGVERAYYSFDRGGWHFVMLDSVQPFADGRSYLAQLDAAQMDWLAADLRDHAGKPTMVLSHIPIFSITPIMAQKPETVLTKAGERNTLIGQGGMHVDWRELKALFKQRPDVKLALSGHMHLVDRVDYEGVSYCCNGAVSGGWWKGKHLGECDAGYALLDLHADGRFTREYVSYGWQFRDEPTTAPAAASA